MFGKGVYFADMVSKSGQFGFAFLCKDHFSIDDLANYCFATREQLEGLILICEIALGNMFQCFKATTLSADTLSKDTKSTKGCGQTIPNPKGTSD